MATAKAKAKGAVHTRLYSNPPPAACNTHPVLAITPKTAATMDPRPKAEMVLMRPAEPVAACQLLLPRLPPAGLARMKAHAGRQEGRGKAYRGYRLPCRPRRGGGSLQRESRCLLISYTIRKPMSWRIARMSVHLMRRDCDAAHSCLCADRDAGTCMCPKSADPRGTPIVK